MRPHIPEAGVVPKDDGRDKPIEIHFYRGSTLPCVRFIRLRTT